MSHLTAESLENAMDHNDLVSLNYQSPATGQNSLGRFYSGTMAMASIFIACFLTTEYFTSEMLLFRFHVLGNISHLNRHFMSDIFTEVCWSIPETAIFFGVLLSIGPRRGLRISPAALTATVVAAVLFSWIRWGIWGLFHSAKTDYPEGLDFAFAVSLVAVLGVLVGAVRRRSLR
jgi:hypothetical protein